jgi:hypothetical protein
MTSWVRFNRTIVIDIISSVDFDVLTCAESTSRGFGVIEIMFLW